MDTGSPRCGSPAHATRRSRLLAATPLVPAPPAVKAHRFAAGRAMALLNAANGDSPRRRSAKSERTFVVPKYVPIEFEATSVSPAPLYRQLGFDFLSFGSSCWTTRLPRKLDDL